eukprot:scaffold35964_cov50-Phaeocystis_antarctica.AAC.1
MERLGVHALPLVCRLPRRRHPRLRSHPFPAPCLPRACQPRLDRSGADDGWQSKVHDPAAVEGGLPGLSWRKVRRDTMSVPYRLRHENAAAATRRQAADTGRQVRLLFRARPSYSLNLGKP